MAILASAIWRCRPAGATTNGAGYDPGIAGAATDYSQQDAAQASGTLGTAAGTAAFSDAGGAFTSAMIGNALRIASGAGFTVGYYFITAFTSSTAVTLDRSPGTGSAAVWKVGGAYGGTSSCPFFLADSARATGNKVVAGNTIYILGVSGSIASPDYSWTGVAANPPVAGDTTSGAITWIGEPSNPIPTMTRTDGDIIFANGGAYHHFIKAFHFKPTSASSGRIFDVSTVWFFQENVFNLNDLDTSALTSPAVLIDNEFFSKTTGTPTSRTTAVLTGSNILPVWVAIGNNFHDLGGPVTNASAGIFLNNMYSKSLKEFIVNGNSDDRGFLLVMNNTLDNTAADVVSLTSAIAVGGTALLNNIFSNNAGSGKFALKLTGTAALNDRLKSFMNFNDYYNNTSNFSNVTIGASDLTLDPQYTSSTDFTLNGTNLQAQAYPRAVITGG